MKKTFKFMLAVAAACAVVLSCEKPEVPEDEPKDPSQEQPETPGEEEEPAPEPTLEVSLTELAFEAVAGEATFTVTTNQDWTAATEAAWITLDPASGAASTEAATVKVTAAENTVTEARTATVTVTAGELTKTIALTQAAAEVVKAERALAFASATAEAVLGVEFTAPALSGEATGVAYSSSNTAVATVDPATGVVTLVAAGETTITATAEENETHLAGSASYTLKVLEPYGTQANPYLVSNVAELQGMTAKLVADATTYFKLTANIDLAGAEWTPICAAESDEKDAAAKPIALNGNGYKVSNLTGANGLFSNLNGSVENLTIDAAKITGAKTAVGVLANKVTGNVAVKNVTITNSSIVSTVGEAGGLIGNLQNGTVENVSVACSVSGTQQLGGLLGVIYGGTVKDCVSSGDVTGANYYIGGLVGYVKSGSIQNSSASGNVTSASTAYSRVGGLIGQIDNATITKCHATGNVKGDGHYCGGLIGVCVTGTTDVKQSYATGNIIMPSTVNKSGGAGFIGTIESGNITVADCYSTGAITAHRWSAAFIGRASAGTLKVTNCYSKSTCTFTQPENCGALLGELNAKATMTYSGVVVWNLSAIPLFIRPDVTEAPAGNYYGTEGTISAKAKEFGWDTSIWDLSKDEPTLK